MHTLPSRGVPCVHVQPEASDGLRPDRVISQSGLSNTKFTNAK